MSKAQDDLAAHQSVIAAADREIERLETLGAKFEKQLARKIHQA
jgi:hypothetical protein